MASSDNTKQPLSDDSPDLARLRQAGWPVHGRGYLPAAAATIVMVALLAYSFQRVGLAEASSDSAEAVRALLGLRESSQVVDAAARFLDQGWPPVISREQETNRIENFDPQHLPWFSRIESREIPRVSFEVENGSVVEREVMESQEVLVEPYGYLFRVIWLMLETLEIAFWGTLLAVVAGFVLSMLGSRRMSPGGPIVFLTRLTCSFSRAVPELISALFFVLLFGFGPAAGILALGLHSAGFLGKFFADDIDNADEGPANALACSGVGRLGVFLHALLPQALPQYLAYVQYILERNVRTATVLGIVGAGGIGVELMGKWHNFQFGHATTVILAIFATVVVLEAATQTLRKKWIAG